MAESETAQKITKLIKVADKLLHDIKKDIEKLLEVAKELKKERDGEEKRL